MDQEEIYPPIPLTLVGDHVKLVPLDHAHRDGLIAAATDGTLWNLWYTTVPSPDTMEKYIDTALDDLDLGHSLPFTVIRQSDQVIVGSTRYLNIESTIKRLEIGATWYAQSVQRTFVNTECKLLLLSHAFEKLNCMAVEFRTHRFNEQSRRAITRLGAVQDGILRNHRVMSDGTIRDTVVYSILNTEWPTVKSHLRFKLENIH